MNSKISLVIIGKNSREFLNKYKDIFKLFDERVYIDDGSFDDTREECKKLGVNYFRRHLSSDFASQRNFALEKTMNKWVFFLDDDEEIDNNFLQEIDRAVTLEKYNGFYVKRKVLFLSHLMEGTEMGNDKVIRLGKKGSGKWVRSVHEYWDVKGSVGVIVTPIIHNTATNLSEFINKISFYYGIHAKENGKSGKRSTLYKSFLYPLLKFIDNFILKKGYKDNVYGLVVSILMSFHTFLSWSQLWLQERSVNTLRGAR